jgi:hypothetical protein
MEALEWLHWAAYNSSTHAAAAAVQVLVAAGASVRARADDGSEPLHWASRNSNCVAGTGAAQALLSMGADPRACDSSGSPPLLLAMERRDAADCHQLLCMLLAGGSTSTEQLISRAEGREGPVLNQLAAAFRQLMQRRGQLAYVVCLDAPCSVALSPCGHLALCCVCGRREWRRCPMCRARTDRTLTIYQS